jgi:hypothetical protein
MLALAAIGYAQPVFGQPASRSCRVHQRRGRSTLRAYEFQPYLNEYAIQPVQMVRVPGITRNKVSPRVVELPMFDRRFRDSINVY